MGYSKSSKNQYVEVLIPQNVTVFGESVSEEVFELK